MLPSSHAVRNRAGSFLSHISVYFVAWWVSAITPSAVTFLSCSPLARSVPLRKRVISYVLSPCLPLLTHSSAIFLPGAAPTSPCQAEPPISQQDACQHCHTFSHSTTSPLGDQGLHAAFKTHMRHGSVQQYNDVFCFAAGSLPNSSLPHVQSD